MHPDTQEDMSQNIELILCQFDLVVNPSHSLAITLPRMHPSSLFGILAYES
jgi:hypothetical protein